jgi:hypothetical protein
MKSKKAKKGSDHATNSTLAGVDLLVPRGRA